MNRQQAPRSRPALARRERRERAERKDRNRKKPDLLAAARVGMVLLLAAQGLRVAFTSPRLRLAEVRVAGTKRLTSEDAVRLGEIPVGRNIFTINLVKVGERLKQDPVFEEAMVTRDLPDRLTVELRERVSAMVVACSGKRWHADRQGVVFEEAKEGGQLPVLEVPEKALPAPGERLAPDLLAHAWECVRLASAEKVALRKMRVDGSGELWLTVDTSPTTPAAADALSVQVGRPTDLAEKFHDIRQVLLVRPNLSASAAYLNVMCAGRPAYMALPKKGM